MSNMGFSDLDSIRETGIENQVDAKATEIQIHLQTSPPKIIFADNASGMNKEQLAASRRLFNRKEAHDEKNGCFGIGGSVGSSQLTRLSGEATRLSKLQGKPVQQLTLDYPAILKEDKYNLHVHGATKEMSDVWEKYAVNKEHGTLDILECPASVVQDMITTLPSARLGRMYADYLTAGTKITLHIDGKITPITPEDVTDAKNASKVENYSVTVWQKSTGDIIVQFTNGKKQLVFMEDGKQNNEDPKTRGYLPIGTINCVSSIRYKKGAADNWKQTDGGQYFKRVKKIIERFEIAYPSSGDFPERDIIACTRHVWQFSTGLDKLMGIEINKSRMNKSNIHPAIYGTLDMLGKAFSKKFWKELKAHEESLASKPVVEPKPAAVIPTPAAIPKPAAVIPTPMPLVANTLIPVATPAATTKPTVVAPVAVTTQKALPQVQPKAQPKASVIDVPAHQKLVPQSHHDLVSYMKKVKTELNSLDLDAILAKSSNVTEGGIAAKIQALQEVLTFLQTF